MDDPFNIIALYENNFDQLIVSLDLFDLMTYNFN
jgi:hypothetical protein